LPWVILLLIAPVLFKVPITHDEIWRMWIGRQMLHGAQLYRDIIEVNPPLWFWMAVPVDWLSALFHLRSDHLLILVIGCLAALSQPYPPPYT
jgi:hypothetical protein